MAFGNKWTLQEATDKAVEALNKAADEQRLYGQSFVKVTSDDEGNIDYENIPIEAIFAEAEDGTTVKFTYECEGFWPKIVSATKIGDLALEFTADDWEVYHLPTLSKFNIINGDYTKEQLISWCEAVQKELLPDWEILRGLTPERFKNKDCTWTEQQAKDRVQQMCSAMVIK